MEKETLEQRYNTFYEEYKVYNDYAVKIAEQVKKDREDFNKFATENQNSPQELVNKLFEINEKQILHLTDLASLKGRLKIATELLVDVIDIPEEVLKEVKIISKNSLSTTNVNNYNVICTTENDIFINNNKIIRKI